MKIARLKIADAKEIFTEKSCNAMCDVKETFSVNCSSIRHLEITIRTRKVICDEFELSYLLRFVRRVINRL